MSFARIVIAGFLAAVVVGCQDDASRLEGHLERAGQYMEEEQFREAIIELKSALQIDPNHAPAHDGLAQSYLGNGQVKEAYWELSETVRLDPGNVKARLNYAAVSLAATGVPATFFRFGY